MTQHPPPRGIPDGINAVDGSLQPLVHLDSTIVVQPDSQLLDPQVGRGRLSRSHQDLCHGYGALLGSSQQARPAGSTFRRADAFERMARQHFHPLLPQRLCQPLAGVVILPGQNAGCLRSQNHFAAKGIEEKRHFHFDVAAVTDQDRGGD